MANRAKKIDLDAFNVRRFTSVARLLHEAFNVCRDRVLDKLTSHGHPSINISHGVVLRNWIPFCIIFVGTMFYVIGCVFVVIDKLFILGDARCCLHDHLASTRVVEKAHWLLDTPGVKRGASTDVG